MKKSVAPLRKLRTPESVPRVTADAGGGLAPAAERALAIFEAFQRVAQPLTLSRLAEEISAPVSSCYNLVRTLIGLGYLFSLESQRTFYPTRKLWDLANAIVAHDPLVQRVAPHAERLREATGETVIVGKWQERTALYLLVLEGPQTIRYVAASGRTIPLHTSAIGKALLSTLDVESMERWLAANKLEQITAGSITDRDELRRDILNGKQLGYFMTAGENVPDVGALAAPVNLRGDTIAIAVAGPTARIQSNRQAIVRALKQTAAELESSAS